MAEASTIAEQARRQIAAGRAEQARAALGRALQRAPSDGALNRAMAEALAALGDAERALYYSERAARADPGDAGALAAHGTLLTAAGRFAEAAAALERAVALAPDHHQVRVNLAGALLMDERYGEALEHCRRARASGFDHPFLTATLTASLRCLGRVEEALPLLREALRGAPDDPMLVESFASALNYAPDADATEVAAAHRARGAQIAREAAALARRAGIAPAPPPRPEDADRPLRLGIVSPDLRTHSVAYFAEPLLRGLAGAPFERRVYFTGNRADSTTGRLRALADAWRDCAGLDDAALARAIRADAVDVVLELSGYSSGHRLRALAMRPAPFQVTAIGYPNTTGVAAIDARIIDSLTDPPGAADPLASERLLRLDPCFLCYRPPDGAPAASPVPPSQRGPAPTGSIAFGSFNNLQKTTGRVIDTWAALLRRVPGSSLLLKSPGLRQVEVRDDVRARFAARGIDPARVEALPPTGTVAEHLARYERVDIALDTFPYNGTTTTCEALLMGVPVVSLAGRSHAGRVGLSLLSALGLADLCAPDEAGYIDAAAALAGDPPRLASLRAGLRRRLLDSVLCDAAGYGARLDRLLREAWRQRCREPMITLGRSS
jgi:predicted O-linked N-acetylglucosamine transferase (SPINDLY family)